MIENEYGDGDTVKGHASAVHRYRCRPIIVAALHHCRCIAIASVFVAVKAALAECPAPASANSAAADMVGTDTICPALERSLPLPLPKWLMQLGAASAQCIVSSSWLLAVHVVLGCIGRGLAASDADVIDVACGCIG